MAIGALLLVLSIGAYLNDSELLNEGEKRFRELIDVQIEPDGTMPLEMDRSNTKNSHGGPGKGKNGIWYTNYSLMPKTLSAEILFLNGRNVFNYSSPRGGSLKVAFEKVSEWCSNPQSFPYYRVNDGKVKGLTYISYFEILNQLWPNELATKLLEKNRPLTSEASFPDLTFTHAVLDSRL